MDNNKLSKDKMETGNGNVPQVNNNQPVQQNDRVTSDNLFGNVTLNDLGLQQPIVNNNTGTPIVPPATVSPAQGPDAEKNDGQEHPISSEQQLNQELEKARLERANAQPVAQPKPEETPAYLKGDIFADDATPKPDAKDWKREYEAAVTQLRERESMEDDFIRNYAQLKQVPGFDFDKFIRDYVVEDFTSLTLEQKYDRYLSAIPGITADQKEVEIAKLENMTVIDKVDLDRRITSELQKSNKPNASYSAAMQADIKKHQDQAVLQQQREHKATVELQTLSTSVVGRNIGGLEVTAQMAERALNSLYDPASAIAFFNADGTYDTKRMLRAALIEQNFDGILLKTVEKARLDFFKERSNPSFVSGNAITTPTENDPEGAAVRDFLAEEGLKPKRLG